MTITALGYIGVHSSKLEDWNALATGLIGMQKVDGGGATSRVSHGRSQAALRRDGRERRPACLLRLGDQETPTGLDEIASRVDDFGVKVVRATSAEADDVA